jgi:hypothetical protein
MLRQSILEQISKEMVNLNPTLRRHRKQPLRLEFPTNTGSWIVTNH